VADELARFVGRQVAAGDEPGGHVVALPGNATLRIRGASQVQRLADDFGRATSERALSRATPRQLLQRFVRRAVLSADAVQLAQPNARFFAQAVTSSRAMAQGIVVGGSRAWLVRVHRNLVADAIEGIHVGVSGADAFTVNAGDVILDDNVVACAVPFFWNRDRHAYYVGSVNRLSLLDNSASLRRTGASPTALTSIAPTPVEAVRLYGRSGPWLSVRGLTLTGPFSVGVAVTDLSVQARGARLHYVSDVLNSSGAGPALTPDTIPHDRCVP
jgi:hypothetical protein